MVISRRLPRALRLWDDDSFRGATPRGERGTKPHMPVQVLLWDIGGVFLTNGWDTPARERLARRFQLDFAAFEARHQAVVDAFERGQMDEAEYWRQTVLAVAAPGTVEPAALRAFLRAQSRPCDETLALLRELAESGRWQLGMLNNESRELNQYRIDYFGLNRYFTVCFSSCWMDARKPDALIYERALNLLQRRPEEIVFTDDREQNLVYPRMMGWRTIHFQNAAQLREELRRCGVDPARAA